MTNQSYICTKACLIGSEPYKPGDQIKPGAIRAGREGALIRMGLIVLDNRPSPDAAANSPVLPPDPNATNLTGNTPEDTTGGVKDVKDGDEQTNTENTGDQHPGEATGGEPAKEDEPTGDEQKEDAPTGEAPAPDATAAEADDAKIAGKKTGAKKV